MFQTKRLKNQDLRACLKYFLIFERCSHKLTQETMLKLI
jgi:hypothetical protein